RLQGDVHEQLNCVEVLGHFGYDRTIVGSTFCSTKIWLQLLLELKRSLQGHTLELVGSMTSGGDDPTSLSRFGPSDSFGFSDQVPDLPPLQELIELQPANEGDMINRLRA